MEQIEPSQRRVRKLVEKLLDQHEELMNKGNSLSRDEVIRLTAKMKRENFKPKHTGGMAVREFLEAGFLDCAHEDLKRMGLNSETITLWANQQTDIVVHELSKNAMNHTVVFNLDKNADRHPIKNYEKPKSKSGKKTKAPDSRSCYGQRLARKAARRSARQRKVDEQLGSADH